VLENLQFYAGVYEIPRATEKERIQDILRTAGLESRPRAMTGSLSGGWRQRLALGCAMLHRPPLLFLDEPTSGVDPVARREFWDLIYQFAFEEPLSSSPPITWMKPSTAAGWDSCTAAN